MRIYLPEITAMFLNIYATPALIFGQILRPSGPTWTYDEPEMPPASDRVSIDRKVISYDDFTGVPVAKTIYLSGNRLSLSENTDCYFIGRNAGIINLPSKCP